MAGWYGGTSPSTMPWSPPAAAKKSKAPKKSKERKEPKREQSEPRKQKVLGGQRLWNSAPAQRADPAPRQAPAPKPRQVIKFGNQDPYIHRRNVRPGQPQVGPELLGGPKINPGALGDKEWWQKPLATVPGGYSGPKMGPQPEKPRGVIPSGQSLVQQQRADMGDLGVSQEDQNTLARQQGMPETKVGPNSQPGIAPLNPAPPENRIPEPMIPAPSDELRKILNDRNWKLPAKEKTVGIPKSAYEKGSFTELRDHDYNLTNEEWTRIQNLYSSDAARKAGYKPPTDAASKVDKNMPLMNMEPEESASLSWKSYENMDDDQQAAVDFNTVLVDAREKDLRKKINLSAVDKAEYDKQVLDLFGEGRGSKVTAVNTVGLLDELNMDLVGQDLDEYLSLERAIDDKELKSFDFSPRDVETLKSLADGGTSWTPEQQYAEVRSPDNQRAVDTAGIRNTQDMVQQKLQEKGAVAYSFDTLVHGDPGLPPMGFGDEKTKWTNPDDADKDAWFQNSLRALSSPDPHGMLGIPKNIDPMGALLGDIDAKTGSDPVQRQEFLDYLANTANLLGQYGTEENKQMAALITKRAGLGG